MESVLPGAQAPKGDLEQEWLHFAQLHWGTLDGLREHGTQYASVHDVQRDLDRLKFKLAHLTDSRVKDIEEEHSDLVALSDRLESDEDFSNEDFDEELASLRRREWRNAVDAQTNRIHLEYELDCLTTIRRFLLAKWEWRRERAEREDSRVTRAD